MQNPREERRAYVSDDQWREISPLLNLGMAIDPDERPDLRQAVEALLTLEASYAQPTGAMPRWVEDPGYAAALHARWQRDGTANRIRNLYHTSQTPSQNALEAQADTERTSRQPTASPSQKPAEPEESTRTVEPAHYPRPAPTPDLPCQAATAPARQAHPVAPEPAAPKTSYEMVKEIEN